MNKRNIFVTNVARIIASQFLVIAVFFCACMILKNADRFEFDLDKIQIIVKMCLIILSLLVATAGIILMQRIGEIAGLIPDSIGLRQSREILGYAYDSAGDALKFKMTVSGVILTGGMVCALIIMSVCGLSENGTLAAKIVFFVMLAIATIVFLPSFDRMLVYKKLIDGSVKRSEIKPGIAKKIRIMGAVAFIAIPLSTCIYLLWKYFGNNGSIAFVVYAIILMLFGTAAALMSYND